MPITFSPGRLIRRPHRVGHAFAMVVAGVISWCRPAAAHGFGQRYDLPLPLDLYLWGAGLTVGLSFVLAALFLGVGSRHVSYPTLSFNRVPLASWLTARPVIAVLRLVTAALFVLIIIAGLIGTQRPVYNIAPTLFWIIWWVGIAYLSALVGNIWAAINPLDALFLWTERAGSWSNRAVRPWPTDLSCWPGVGLMFALAWMELVWGEADHPRILALAIIGYSALTWWGMWRYGRRAWLDNAEVSSLVFGLFSRFAPTETLADAGDREFRLRPLGAGLLVARPMSKAMTALTILVLATVTFDGLTETMAWRHILEAVVAIPGVAAALRLAHDIGIPPMGVLMTLGLLLLPALFLIAFWLVCRIMAVVVGLTKGTTPVDWPVDFFSLGGTFVFSLVPIAIAYHLAHYLSYFLVAGQFAIPLASDPFGYGWNLFGTKTYLVDVGIITARTVWFFSLGAIVLGHVIAVALAHRQALIAFGDRRIALISQIPMIFLMIGYTMASLWIIAQPIVRG